MRDYPISKPRPSASFWLLSVLVLVGLVALFLAADFAFSRIMHNHWQAAFAAGLIEAGMIVEAIAVMRSQKNWPALIGLVISLVVSGTYNYIQAEQAGLAAGITNPWQLLTLALGPLSALAFLAMAVGRELGEHEKRLATWQVKRQEWLEAWEARRHAQEIEAEKMRLNAELKKEKELARLELRERRRLQPAQLPEIAKDSEATSGNLPKLRGNRLKVYEVAKGEPNATHQEIADMLAISRQAVTSHIGKLREAGYLNGNHKGV